jgi:hypothetical protein
MKRINPPGQISVNKQFPTRDDAPVLGFAIPALFFRTGITVLEDLRTGIPVPEPGFTVV